MSFNPRSLQVTTNPGITPAVLVYECRECFALIYAQKRLAHTQWHKRNNSK